MAGSEHPLRETILAEVHARPFVPAENGARLVHLGFAMRPDNDPFGELLAWCALRGVAAPAPGAKHHSAALGEATLSWELHSEFVTATLRIVQPGAPLAARPPVLEAFRADPPSQGDLLVAADLHLVEGLGEREAQALFDRASLVASEVKGGAALVFTDLKADAEGFVRWLVVNRHPSPRRAGALAQRLLEVETYRNFALLGLPEAQRVMPMLRRIESDLATVAGEMTASEGLEANHRLLDRLTALASELEAEAARSAYRFGASRAYHELVRQRLDIIGETGLSEGTTIGGFLDRRLGPAMRTCRTTVDRQAELSRKLSNAANLLRTRVDVELERQNRDLLSAMNERAQMQLRLQQTVEGLSVAAISYYVVGLFGYVAKGLKDVGLVKADPSMLTAAFVPLAILGVWLSVRRIRRAHSAH